MKTSDLLNVEIHNGIQCIPMCGYYIPLDDLKESYYETYWVPDKYDYEIEQIATQHKTSKRNALAVIIYLGLQSYYKGE